MKENATRSISMLSNKVRRKLSALSFQKKFSGAQGRTLHFILVKSDEEIFQKDVEEEYSLRPPTATHLLKEMEKNGLITRESVPYDARLKKIVATKKAMQYKGQVVSELEELEKELTNGISEEDMKVFFSVIKKMLHNLA